MKLILMTPPYFFTEEHQILNALFDEGLELLHIRKPDSAPVYSERLLSLIRDNYHKRIVVHDHFYLSHEYRLRGIHLNQRNTQLPDNYKGQISCTCHTALELASRTKMCDYVFLAPPIAPEGQQTDATYFSPEQLSVFAAHRVIGKKVMAFGHMTLDHVSMLRDYGFGGIVILGDLWNRFGIHSSQDFKPIITQFRKLKRAAEG